jgi:hypothetical protein
VQCGSAGRSQQNWTSRSDDGRRSWRVSWTGDGCSVELRAEGRIIFNDDVTDIDSISPGGYLEIAEREGSNLRRFEARPGRSGELERNYWVNGERRPFDADARAWLATFLTELDRRTAFSADTRFPRLYGQGGPRAVLEEIGRMSGDYAKGVYFRKLLDTTRLDDATLRRAIGQAGRDISSDYELARILTVVADRYDLADHDARAAYIDAAKTLESDYERTRVIMALLGKGGTPDRDVTRSVLEAMATVKSDYELSRVLVALAGRKVIDESLQPAYLAAAGSLKSDYERSRSLMALIDAAKLTRQSVLAALRLAGAMSSDYEMARVLVRIAADYPMDGDARDAYLKAADRIRSDYEQRRVLSALVKRL